MNITICAMASLVGMMVTGVVPASAATGDTTDVQIPLVIFGDATLPEDYSYVPSGWMGNFTALQFDDQCTDAPWSDARCIRISYMATSTWAGIAWQYPKNDWGDKPNGHDLTGARKLTFWARGQSGGEKVEFKMGILGKGVLFPDSGSASRDVILSREWRQYSLNLTGKKLNRIKTGFCIVVVGKKEPTTFYLDDIKYE